MASVMPLLILLAQCVAMFVASFLVGSLPLMFKSASSGKRIKAISVFGMGILVGAALTIIIPEGVSTLYGSFEQGDPGERTVQAVGFSLLLGFGLMLLIESLTPHPPHSPPSSPSLTPPSPQSPFNPLSHRDSADSMSPDLPHHMDPNTPIIPKRLHIRERDHESGGKRSFKDSAVQGLNATLGLVIHGAADGIALGASSLSGRGSLGLIVFIAVLVHKGPTALGLTTTLLSFNLTPPMIRRRLIIFSFAAPLSAIVTYLLVGAFGGKNAGTGHSGGSVDGIGWWTGVVLLFSGGSFLYVATVIQPLSSSDPHSHSHSGHTQAESAHHRHDDDENDDDAPLSKYVRTGLLVCGMVFPALLSWVVGDGDH